MGTQIVFETHSITEDNELGIATGWLPGRLSTAGRSAAQELGRRRGNDGLAAVFTSDLRRAVETAEIAFPDRSLPIFHDWRLRECNYGIQNGRPRDEVHGKRIDHLDTPYQQGESWVQAIRRVNLFLRDLSLLWEDSRVLVIGHVATRWAFEYYLNKVPLEDLMAAEFSWQPGWSYSVEDPS